MATCLAGGPACTLMQSLAKDVGGTSTVLVWPTFNGDLLGKIK